MKDKIISKELLALKPSFETLLAADANRLLDVFSIETNTCADKRTSAYCALAMKRKLYDIFKGALSLEAIDVRLKSAENAEPQREQCPRRCPFIEQETTIMPKKMLALLVQMRRARSTINKRAANKRGVRFETQVVLARPVATIIFAAIEQQTGFSEAVIVSASQKSCLRGVRSIFVFMMRFYCKDITNNVILHFLNRRDRGTIFDLQAFHKAMRSSINKDTKIGVQYKKDLRAVCRALWR